MASVNVNISDDVVWVAANKKASFRKDVQLEEQIAYQ
jgi:hypothetical protein